MSPRRLLPASGVLFALGAYGAWGLLPVYWKALERVPLLEIVAHRVLWSLGFAALLLQGADGWSQVREVMRSPRLLLAMSATSLLIGSNWLLFIWAVNAGHVLATSLGYFLNPLVSVLLGVAFLRERLRLLQTLAVGLAAFGVLQLALREGGVPWISLLLAGTFALYGLLRKLAPIRPLAGLAVELLLLAPLAAGYLLWLGARHRGAFLAEGWGFESALLGLAGVATATPLLWFTAAARRLRLSTLGLFQYLAPSLSFGLAVAVYHEPFTRSDALTFGCIWAALALYSSDSARALRSRRRELPARMRYPEDRGAEPPQPAEP